MNQMKKILLLLAMIAVVFYAQAQNDTHFSHYMFNESTFNPASVEVSNTINASLVARQQWVGFPDKPSSQVLNASTYVQELFGAVGLNLINDQLGHEKTITARAYYAFPLQIGVMSSLTFGLGAGIINRSFDGSKLRYEDITDPNAVFIKDSHLKADFNFGIEFNAPNLSVGLASTHLDRSVKGSTLFQTPRHYYLYGKYRFEDVADNLDIEPFLLFKSSWFITSFDINVIAYYDNMFWGGFSYRLQDAIVAMVGYNITPEIKVGYCYDYSIGTTKRYSGGSHEIMISTTFEGFNKTRVTPKTPRIFN